MQEEEKKIETVIMEDLEYIKKRLWWIYEGGTKQKHRLCFFCERQQRALAPSERVGYRQHLFPRPPGWRPDKPCSLEKNARV